MSRPFLCRERADGVAPAKSLFAHAIGWKRGAFASEELRFPPLQESLKLDEDDIRSVDSDTSLAALRAVGSDQILKLARDLWSDGTTLLLVVIRPPFLRSRCKS